MLVVGIDAKQVQLDMPFRTQKDLLAPVNSLTQTIFFELGSKVHQRFGDNDEIALGEMILGHFFLLNGLLKGEIIVIDVTMQNVGFDTQLGI